MTFNPEADQFFADMNERAKGYDPEMSRLVDELRLQQLGKPIVFEATPPGQRMQERIVSTLEKVAGQPQTTSDQSPQSHDEELIGYILPVNLDQTRHLVFFKDGAMFVVEPKPSWESKYRDTFNPNEHPAQATRSTLAEVKNNLIISYNTYSGCKLLYRNDNPEHTTEIDSAREEAMQTAILLKEQRIKSIADTSARLKESLRRLLFPPDPQQPDQPQ